MFVECPEVPTVVGAVADTTDTTCGTTVFYSCTTFGQDFVSLHPGSINCSVRGSWTKPPVCRSKLGMIQQCTQVINCILIYTILI